MKVAHVIMDVIDMSYLDSQPGTPMSVESACSEGNKLKLKIKVRLIA